MRGNKLREGQTRFQQSGRDVLDTARKRTDDYPKFWAMETFFLTNAMSRDRMGLKFPSYFKKKLASPP